MAEADTGYTLRIERSMAGLTALGAWVDHIAAALRLSRTAEYALRLCTEEAAANIVMHGEPVAGGDTHWITLTVHPTAESMVVTVEDQCRGFDPIQAPAAILPQTLESARIGGMGLHLLRQYAKALDYQRIGSTNRLTIELAR